MKKLLIFLPFLATLFASGQTKDTFDPGFKNISGLGNWRDSSTWHQIEPAKGTNVGWGMGALSSDTGQLWYEFLMGRFAGDFLIRGNYNIVVKDSGLMMVEDTSFVFLVDFQNKYLQKYPDVKTCLHLIDHIFKQRPDLRTNVPFQIVIHEYLNQLMRIHIDAEDRERYKVFHVQPPKRISK